MCLRGPGEYQRWFVGDIGAGTVWALLLYNRGYDNNAYRRGVVGVVVVVVVGNVDSGGSFCYSLACSSVACLGFGGGFFSLLLLSNFDKIGAW